MAINMTTANDPRPQAMTAGVSVSTEQPARQVRNLPASSATVGQRRFNVLFFLVGTRAFMALCSFGLFIGAWHVTATWIDNRVLLPSPAQVAGALYQLGAEGEIFEHALVSTTRLAISLVVAVGLAIPLGFAMGLNDRLNAYIDPLVELLRPISGIAWIPLGLFIFGIGDTLPVFIMVYVAFFPLLLNTIAGVRGVDGKLVNAARTMGVKRGAMLLHVFVPPAHGPRSSPPNSLDRQAGWASRSSGIANC
jgi:ABC-type nitrate/sulfonate/bicarbonate transport system permease component